MALKKTVEKAKHLGKAQYIGKGKRSGEAQYVRKVDVGVATEKVAVRDNIAVRENIGKIIHGGKPKKIIDAVSYDWNDDSRGFALVTVIRDGIDYKTFERVAVKTPLKDNDWAVVLDTTTRTLVRYKKDNKTFAPKQTEKIIEIQQLMQYGNEVFGDMDSFHSWLMMENVAMGGVSPKELLDTSVGLGIVKDMLGRIEHGILA